ncbi:hypothetical protein BN2127_JRS9_03980 [Bacillus subtilis]|uniref:hypothetical protein n=1 Tax=Bacillus subtilis TaxID=1423 RepID=UPI0006A8323E|nr:hypothetical protein [Bacillus subtilis]CUB22203.1 hypothetical protein BN2127_JRS2_03932 [Bacillus subtilis]CUB59328.1 hypothetical protein BN2127_JRS9_03980 [Bacillus subtilis]
MTKQEIALVIAKYHTDLELDLKLTEEEKELANDPFEVQLYQDKCDVILNKLKLLSDIRQDLRIPDVKFWRGLKMVEYENKKGVSM